MSSALCTQERSLTKILLLATPRINFTSSEIDKALKSIDALKVKVATQYKNYLDVSSLALEMIKKSEDKKTLEEINKVVRKIYELKSDRAYFEEKLEEREASNQQKARAFIKEDIDTLRAMIGNITEQQEELVALIEQVIKKQSPGRYALTLFPHMKDIIEVISSLLSLKTYLLPEDYRYLYRFIQLYPIFVLIDDVEPRPKIYSMLNEMQFLGKKLSKNFSKEDELSQSFNELLKVIDAAAIDVGLKLFAKDLQILVTLL